MTPTNEVPVPAATLRGTRPAPTRHSSHPTQRGQSRRRARRRAAAVAAIFLTPMLIFYGVYYMYAFVFLAQTSTQSVDLSFTGATDVGLQNFRLVLTDAMFWRALVNNLLLAGVQIGMALTLGFVVAVSLSSGVRWRRFFYIVFLLPSLIPMALLATVFGQMLQTEDGAINALLRSIGLGSLAQDWLGNEPSAYVALFVLLTYLIGLPIMYYTADLSASNTEVLEAAMIDGATSGHLYRLILFPMLRSAHKTVILSVLLGSFRAFEVVYFSTRTEPGGRTSITGTYIYNHMFTGVGSQRIGYAAAASLVVLVLAIAISAVNLIVQRRRS